MNGTISYANGAHDSCPACWRLINTTLQVEALPAASPWNNRKEMKLENELSLERISKQLNPGAESSVLFFQQYKRTETQGKPQVTEVLSADFSLLFSGQ